MQDKDSQPDAIDLRRRALDRLKGQDTDDASVWTEQDAVRLVHELNVHQIELELQNEELRQARTEVEAGLKWYTDLYDYAPAGYFTLDRDGSIRQVNLTGAKLLGVARALLVNARFGFFVSPESLPTFNDFLSTALDSRGTKSCEVFMQPRGCDQICVRINTSGGGGDDGGRRISMVDVTASRRAEDARLEYRNRQLEVLNRTARALSVSLRMSDVTAAIGDVIRDHLRSPAGRIFLFNSSRNDLVLQFCWGIKDQSAFRSLSIASFEGKEAITASSIVVIETVESIPAYILAGNAMMRYVCIPLIVDDLVVGAIDFVEEPVNEYGEVETAFCNIFGQQAAMALRNASEYEKVRISEEQMHRLSAQLLSAQESERRVIASELHDEVGASLAVLSLSLDLLGEKTEVDVDGARLHQARQIVSELGDRVHSLSLDLRPPLLDGFGLVPALRCYLDRYIEQTGIDITFMQSGAETRFEPEIETCVYRIVQESLTNVAKHAQTKSASIELNVDKTRVALIIGDTGSGFDIESALADTRSSGLIGMRNRVSSIGGDMHIESDVGAGTRIRVQLPITKPMEAR